MAIENFKKISKDLIDVAKWSIKNKDGETLNKLRNSVFKHKQNSVFLARKKQCGRYEIFKGKEAFKILSEKDIPEFMIYDYGYISELESKIIYLENSIKHSDNFIEVGELIKEISTEIKTRDLERFVNCSHQELEDLINLANFNWDKFLKKEPTATQTALNFE